MRPVATQETRTAPPSRESDRTSELLVTPEALPDEASVDAARRRLETGIEGVLLHMLGPLHVDHRGSLTEVLDVRLPFWQETGPVVYAYRITIRPGRIKGWGMHKLQTDRYFISSGLHRVVLYDGRVDSPTHEHLSEFQFSDATPGLVAIPPGVWHANQNLGDTDVVIINYPTRAFDRTDPDKHRIDVNSGLIPFDFALSDY